MTTPLHHFAFQISLQDYWSEKERLEELGCEVVTTTHGWGHLRSMYLQDPEDSHNLIKLNMIGDVNLSEIVDIDIVVRHQLLGVLRSEGMLFNWIIQTDGSRNLRE